MYPPNGKCGDSEETDPDKLHDLKITLEQYQVYPWEQIDEFVEAFLNGADQSNLDPRLDTCVEKYKKLDEARQVDFKSSACGTRSGGDLESGVSVGINDD